MDEKQIQDLILNTSPDQLAKAVKDAMGLSGIRIIKDLWEDIHALPDRSETKTGPAMHSSGSGAEKALDQYSNPAPQIATTELYDKFTQQNIENFKHLEGSMKSLADEFKSIAGIVADLVKAKEEKKEEEKKDEMKSDVTAKLASYWDKLGELEEAFAKAEDESKDVQGLEAARALIEKAEKHLEEVEAHEKKEEKENSAMKALTAINLGWRSLYKATGLSSYDLHGYGNQKDEAVTGDENADAANKDFKPEGKAFYMALKAKHEKDEKEKKKAMYCAKFNEGEAEKFAGAFENFTKAGLEQAEACSKSKHMKLRKALDKYAAKLGKSQVIGTTPAQAVEKAAEVTPSATVNGNAQVDALKAEFDAKSKELEKSFNDRVSLLNSRINEVTGGKAPGMVPVILKSGGIKSDTVAQQMNDKIEKAVDNAEMSEDHAAIARGLVARYQAAGKGAISTNIVNRQLELAPAEVQNFFQKVEATI